MKGTGITVFKSHKLNFEYDIYLEGPTDMRVVMASGRYQSMGLIEGMDWIRGSNYCILAHVATLMQFQGH